MFIIKTKERCPRCKIRPDRCFCHELQVWKNLTPVIIIMHMRERSLSSNTANLAKISLENCQIRMRGDPRSPLDLSDLKRLAGTSFYLFPYDDAPTLSTQLLSKYPGPYSLIVPDGNWAQAQKVKRREKDLTVCIPVKLAPGRPSEYQLRHSPFAHKLCTFEAIARALGVFEGEMMQRGLEKNLRSMVEKHLLARAKFSGQQSEN